MVLPFGLFSANFIFDKLTWSLVKFRRASAVKIACFLDRLGIEYHYTQANYKSVFVQNTLLKSSFVSNI